MSYVSEIKSASPQDARAYFAKRLTLETDCADVHASMAADEMDFVLLQVIGQPEAFKRRHIPGALHLPHRYITEQRMAQWPTDTLFVVYCAGPHCNGAERGALKLAELGRPVKVMIGGITGWEDEGFAFASGE
ncbi:rhodanese-like domain-containing protein [Sodalis sp. RH21]|uniref:rhodanese-like domain-containing protein n=1 Tax=unclassified Sodalis (in: enterobacteria) TaxID=2636512 RepID=UPI0039B3E026